jgi:hypothetical protein
MQPRELFWTLKAYLKHGIYAVLRIVTLSGKPKFHTFVYLAGFVGIPLPPGAPIFINTAGFQGAYRNHHETLQDRSQTKPTSQLPAPTVV